jgi:micrococcal nuclease
MWRTILTTVVIAVFAATIADAAEQGPTEPAYLYRGIVVRVVDGDTIDVDIDLGFYIWAHNQRIRLVGIDAPEVRGASKEVGDRATAFLKALIEGKTIILKTVKGTDNADRDDSFGRWLGEVYLDGQNVNQMLIESGHAAPYAAR